MTPPNTNESTRPFTCAEVREWLTSYLAQLLGIQRSEVDPSFSFELYGLDSSAAVGISGDLSDLLGHPFETSIAYDYPTINSLVEHLESADIVRER